MSVRCCLVLIKGDNVDSSKLNKKSILIVEDEPDIITVLKRMLERNGFHIDAFTDSIQALANFKPSVYDLVIFDFKMKPINGFELYQEIIKIDPKIKVLFLSGDNDNYAEQIRSLPLLNPKQFLHKPIGMKQFIERVNEILDTI